MKKTARVAALIAVAALTLAGCGDRGTSFGVPASILNDIIRELDPSVDERPDDPFPFDSGPCDTALFLRHREYVQPTPRDEPFALPQKKAPRLTL